MEIVNSTRLKKNKTSLDWHYEDTKVIMCQGASILLDNFCKNKCDKVSILWSLNPFTEMEVKILRWDPILKMHIQNHSLQNGLNLEIPVQLRRTIRADIYYKLYQIE